MNPHRVFGDSHGAQKAKHAKRRTHERRERLARKFDGDAAHAIEWGQAKAREAAEWQKRYDDLARWCAANGLAIPAISAKGVPEAAMYDPDSAEAG